MDLPNDLMDLREVCGVLRDKVTIHTVRRWIAEGVGRPRTRLAGLRLGGKLYVSRANLNKFVMLQNGHAGQFRHAHAKSEDEAAGSPDWAASRA